MSADARTAGPGSAAARHGSAPGASARSAGAGRVPVRDDLVDVIPYGAPQLDVPVRLNTNETPQPPPPAYLAAVAQRLPTLDLHRYPDRSATRLRERLAALLATASDCVWAANGSNEVLLQLFQAYGGPGRRLLLFRPGYSAHPLIARVATTEVVTHDLPDSFVLDPATAADAVARHNPDVVCVASPNNPSGIATSHAAVRALHDAGRALVILDEAYVEFDRRPDAAPPRPAAAARQPTDLEPGAIGALPLLAHLDRLVVTRTYSKAFRLAGLRLGYLVAPAWVVDDMKRVRLPYHLDTMKQAAAEVALDHRRDLLAHIPEVVAERQRVAAELAATPGVERVWPSAANFLLFRTRATDLFERLLARGVLVRDFSSRPRLEGCLRVTIGTPDENDAFLAALRAAIAERPAPDPAGDRR